MKRLRAALVVTVSAACTQPRAPETVEVTHNPPALTPQPPPAAPTCPPRQSIQTGAPCASGLECYLPTGGCQPPGYRCDNGRWREVWSTCNPPPPPGP